MCARLVETYLLGVCVLLGNSMLLYWQSSIDNVQEKLAVLGNDNGEQALATVMRWAARCYAKSVLHNGHFLLCLKCCSEQSAWNVWLPWHFKVRT
jgi:hypothetical protein